MNQTNAVASDASPSDPSVELEQRLSRQSRALVTLAKLEPTPGRDLRPAFQRITEITAQTLGTQRASVWLYNTDRSAIHCVDLFEQQPGRHNEGGVLEKDLFPAYFSALEEERTIPAHDVASDDRVNEFLEAYLMPLGITSMLDAPVRTGGRLAGVLCCEHVGPARHWSWDEQNFVGAVGDMVALAMETNEHHHATELLRQQLAELEQGLRPAVLAVVEGSATLLARPEAEPLRDEIGRLREAGAQLMAILEGLAARR